MTAVPAEPPPDIAPPAAPPGGARGRSRLLIIGALLLLLPTREGPIPRGGEVLRAGADSPAWMAWLGGSLLALGGLTWALRGPIAAAAGSVAAGTRVSPLVAAVLTAGACGGALAGVGVGLSYHFAGFSALGAASALCGLVWWSTLLRGAGLDRAIGAAGMLVQGVGLLYFAMVLRIVPAPTAVALAGDWPYATQTVVQFGAYFAALAAFWIHRAAPREALPTLAVVVVLSLFAAAAQLGGLEPIQAGGTIDFPLSRLLEASCCGLTARVGAEGAARAA